MKKRSAASRYGTAAAPLRSSLRTVSFESGPTLSLKEWNHRSVPAGAKPSPVLGQVALSVACILFAASVAMSVIIGAIAGPFAVVNDLGNWSFTSSPDSSVPTIAAIYYAQLVQYGIGTAVGLWAVIQAIVAIAQNRGRGFGVVAIIVAVLALPATFVAEIVSTWAHLSPH